MKERSDYRSGIIIVLFWLFICIFSQKGAHSPWNCYLCHHMLFLNSKYAKIVFPTGVLLHTTLEQLTAFPQIPQLDLKGQLCSRKFEGREGREKEGVEKLWVPFSSSWIHPCCQMHSALYSIGCQTYEHEVAGLNPPMSAVYQCQLSMPSLWGRLMSTSKSWGVNGHTTW